MKTLFFLAAAMSFTAFSQDWYQDISGAGFRQIRQNDTTALELSGRTKQQKNTNYFIGTIHLDKPLNLTGKQVRLKITTSTPGEIIALAVRFYNAGEKTPCWSFMKWGKVFDGTGAIAPALFPGQNKILAWEKAKVNGKAADRVDTIRFWLGSVTPDVNISAVFGNFTISDAPRSLAPSPRSFPSNFPLRSLPRNSFPDQYSLRRVARVCAPSRRKPASRISSQRSDVTFLPRQ